MNGLFKTLIAGWGAKKLGGGCIGTVIVFIIIFYLLGYLQNLKEKLLERKMAPKLIFWRHFNCNTFSLFRH